MYIITLHNNISRLVKSVSYRYECIQALSLTNIQLRFPRFSVITITDIRGSVLVDTNTIRGSVRTVTMPLANRGFPVKALSHGRKCGDRNYDVALSEKPEGVKLLNHQIAVKQAMDMRKAKTVAERTDRERSDTQERLKWGDW